MHSRLSLLSCCFRPGRPVPAPPGCPPVSGGLFPATAGPCLVGSPRFHLPRGRLDPDRAAAKKRHAGGCPAVPPSKVLSQRESRGLTPWSPCHRLPPANVLLGLRPPLRLLVISAVAKTLPLTLIFLCKVTRQTISSWGLWPVSWEVGWVEAFLEVWAGVSLSPWDPSLGLLGLCRHQ